MGEENKNVKKPAVSNAVVKKKTAGTGTKSTGSTRPGNGTKSAGGTHTNKTGSGAKKRSRKQWRQRKKHQRTFR